MAKQLIDPEDERRSQDWVASTVAKALGQFVPRWDVRIGKGQHSFADRDSQVTISVSHPDQEPERYRIWVERVTD